VNVCQEVQHNPENDQTEEFSSKWVLFDLRWWLDVFPHSQQNLELPEGSFGFSHWTPRFFLRHAVDVHFFKLFEYDRFAHQSRLIAAHLSVDDSISNANNEENYDEERVATWYLIHRKTSQDCGSAYL
jgi:hypothetical protein